MAPPNLKNRKGKPGKGFLFWRVAMVSSTVNSLFYYCALSFTFAVILGTNLTQCALEYVPLPNFIKPQPDFISTHCGPSIIAFANKSRQILSSDAMNCFEYGHRILLRECPALRLATLGGQFPRDPEKVSVTKLSNFFRFLRGSGWF